MVSFPPLPASGDSRHPSLGWWPPPPRFCLRLHVASALCPRLSCVLLRTLSLDLGPASSRRPHFKILYFIPSAKIFYFKMKLLSKVLDLFIETIGRKAMTNLDSVFNSRDVTLPATVRLVKAVVFPVVMYGCESWTVMKAECRLMDAFEVQCWRRLLRVPWTARRSNQSILKEISPEFSLEGLILKLKLQFFGYLM